MADLESEPFERGAREGDRVQQLARRAAREHGQRRVGRGGGDFQRAELLPEGALDETSWGAWTNALKEATGRKGRELFMPLRQALTGQPRGPEMHVLLPLIPRETVLRRLQGETI
jgi:glutamyl/glutaminyl-tRNA synthetase